MVVWKDLNLTLQSVLKTKLCDQVCQLFNVGLFSQ